MSKNFFLPPWFYLSKGTDEKDLDIAEYWWRKQQIIEHQSRCAELEEKFKLIEKFNTKKKD